MKSALIGYTGFVGSNIAAKHSFDDLYNSKNIADIHGKTYDLVVSAANRAEMWRINQEPEKDLSEIKEFISHIEKANIKKLVLISTVGVYKQANGVDEDTPIDQEGLLPYGKNRYYLEQFCRDHFDTTVIRLPGLFGPGLKKNVIFDLLNDNNTDRIHADGIYQYYNLENTWKDIALALQHNLLLVNFATEPVSTREVAQQCFGIDFANRPTDITPAFWDMHSKYGEVFGSENPYLYTKAQVLDDIKLFIKNYKKSA
jgi:nucleoside-diphosphate-sugar epimerase